MADKSVISNLEARVRQLIEAHRRMAEHCAELEAQQETLRAEKRSLEERVRELDAEVARMQLTEGLAGDPPTGRKRVPVSIALCGRWTNASRWSGRRRRQPQTERLNRPGPGPGIGSRRSLMMRRRQRDRVNETKTMAKQAITLKIAGKSYPFTIESGKEEMYRLAEREVNNYLALIKQQNIRNWTDMDYLSMTALKFAIAEIGMRQSRELGSEDLRRLEALDSEIGACLNDPKL